MQKNEDACITNTKISRLAGSSMRKMPAGLVFYTVVLFIYSALLLLVCTRNSPLFAYQTWNDPNIYMDVGKAVRDGSVLYRDIFDHKGPLLLLCFSVLSMIFPHTMTGVYLLQTLTLGASLTYLFRTARMFLPDRASFTAAVIFPFFLLNNLTYGPGGGSAEELILPCFMGGMFFLARAFIAREPEPALPVTPARVPYIVSDFFLQGVFAGAVIMVKINLSVFFAAGCGILFIHFLIRKKWKYFLQSAWRFFAGVFAAMLPCLVYFTWTGSFADFWNTYIIFNLKYASTPPDNGRMSFLEAMGNGLYLNLAAVLCFALGLLVLGLKGKNITVSWIWTIILIYAAMLTAVFITGRAYTYQYIPLLCFTGIGEIGITLAVIKLWKYFPSLPSGIKIPSAVSTAFRAVSFAGLAAVIILSNTLYPGIRLLKPEKTPAQKISDTIILTWKPEKEGEDPSILFYNTGDIGICELTDSIPKLRVFYMPIINLAVYPDLLEVQQGYIRDGLADYIVYIVNTDEGDSAITDINPIYRIADMQGEYSDGLWYFVKLYKKAI